jgi:hypothetical protein
MSMQVEATYSQLCYNLSLGAAVTYMFLWHWTELRAGMSHNLDKVENVV